MLREELLNRLDRQASRLSGTLERINLEEYLKYLGDKKRVFKLNFLAGVARGLGAMVGFTLLGAALIVLLRNVVVDNIPLIGEFLAEVIRVALERQ